MYKDPCGEEQYADGFAEYGSFYGGPSFNYLAPAKSASTAAHELSAGSITRCASELHLEKASGLNTKVTHATRAAPDTDGLQVVSPYRARRIPFYDEGLELDISRVRSGNKFATIVGFPPRSQHVQGTHATMPRLYQYPPPPTSPSSPTEHYRHTESPTQPQPLHFTRRPPTIPPTPPMSYGSSVSGEEALIEKMQSLDVSVSQLDGDKAREQLRIGQRNLVRVDTTSSRGSDWASRKDTSSDRHLSEIPTFQREGVFVTDSITRAQGDTMVEDSLDEAQAEILRRLHNEDDGYNQKDIITSSSLKKGFALKRKKVYSKNSNVTSQDALTDVLEEVAETGDLALVKAALALGADPVYRSNGKFKRVKHEALARASMKGHAAVVDHLIRKGATYGDRSKKETFTPIDKALLAAAYRGHMKLVVCLIRYHGANPVVEQWPREMFDTQHYWADNQVRLAKSSVLDALSHHDEVEEGMEVLRVIMQHSNFTPHTPAVGVFDTKSELQTAEFGYRPWQTTYEYSALSCFVQAGWADAVEEMLQMIDSPVDFEKADEVLQYQDKVTRHISPINALTKDTWEKRPEDSLRILKLLLERGFSSDSVQRSATDLGLRTALGRAISADAAQGVELLLQHSPNLVRKEIYFRRSKKETKALPLAAALSSRSLECVRVLLRAGAHPRDPAFDNMNVLQFTAHHGGLGPAVLSEMIELAPELTYTALEIGILRFNRDVVRVLLNTISEAAVQGLIAELPPIYDTLLRCAETDVDIQTRASYLSLIDMIVQWDVGQALQPPQLPVILLAIRGDNFIGMARFLELGIVDGRTLGLNSKAQLPGEQGSWTMLECCELTDRSAEWLGLLRKYGAPLYR